MADLERQFREALETPDVETASDPAMMAPEGDGDMRCPCCGASAMKIVQASQPPMGGMKDAMK